MPEMGRVGWIVLAIEKSELRSDVAESPRTCPENPGGGRTLFIGELRISSGLFAIDGEAGPGVPL